MLRSLLRLLYTNLYLSFRSKAKITKHEGALVYSEDFYDELAKDVHYTITITEVIWIVNYNLYLIPKLKRKQYRAVLTYYVNGEVDRIFKDTYPKLNRGVGSMMSKFYPWTMIAEQHIATFFESEYTP